MAAVLEVVGPLVTLLSQAADPVAVAAAAVACVERDDPAALVAGIDDAVEDGRLVGPVLRFAGVLDEQGHLGPLATVRAGQALVLLEAREQVWSPGWELLVTVPSFLRERYSQWAEVGVGGPGPVRETGQAVLEVAASARSRLIIASPYLRAAFIEGLVPSLRQVLAGGGEVFVLTRALSFSAPQRSSANAEAVQVLHEAGAEAAARGGRLVVRSWEGSSLGIHFKAVVADDEWAYLGSANLTTAGAGVQAETGALLRGKSVQTLGSWLRLVAEELGERYPASAPRAGGATVPW